jgi:phospholipase D1/2
MLVQDQAQIGDGVRRRYPYFDNAAVADLAVSPHTRRRHVDTFLQDLVRGALGFKRKRLAGALEGLIDAEDANDFMGKVSAGGIAAMGLVARDMQAPPRFHFRLDGVHPSGACHHQKVVVIDDRIAFASGIDLSRWRWDTCEHKPDDPRRTDPNGMPYQPFHDLMMLVEGDAAMRLGELARARWRRAQGWKVKPPRRPEKSPWPRTLAAELKDVQVAIARTEPAHRGRAAVQEIGQLYADAIAAAQNSIYIENQYFTAHRLADALARRLGEPDGPEVVIVLPERTGGWLERVTMDVVRARVLDRLAAADAHDRLRVYYPYQPGLVDDCIIVHAKLLIVDDRFLRIGSSNASNRSMGLDTECDLALEATVAQTEVAAYIAKLRARLLAEHLGCGPDEVAIAIDEQSGLIPAIENLRCDRRSLRDLDWSVDEEVERGVPDSALLDPTEPLSPQYVVDEYVPETGRKRGRRRLLVFASLVLSLLVLAAAWRWTPLRELLSPERIGAYLAAVPSAEGRALIAIGAFVVASLAMVPVTLLAVIGGVVFGGWQAFAYVLAGTLLASALGFLLGRWLGRAAIERMSGSRLEILSKRLAERGTVAVALLRLVPVAPFAVFNLVAGSSHLGARQFLVGSLIGLAPGLAAITLFSGSLWQAIRSPSLVNVAIALCVGAALLVAACLVLRRAARRLAAGEPVGAGSRRAQSEGRACGRGPYPARATGNGRWRCRNARHFEGREQRGGFHLPAALVFAGNPISCRSVKAAEPAPIDYSSPVSGLAPRQLHSRARNLMANRSGRLADRGRGHHRRGHIELYSDTHSGGAGPSTREGPAARSNDGEQIRLQIAGRTNPVRRHLSIRKGFQPLANRKSTILSANTGKFRLRAEKHEKTKALGSRALPAPS